MQRLVQPKLSRNLIIAVSCCSAGFALNWFACVPVPPPGETEPIVPADYRTTFSEVRDCRNSIEHAATIRVWVNAIGAEAYLADENPLPVGTVVVKEEFAGANCTNDAELRVLSAMRKEPAGFDPEANDWHFQELNFPSRSVRLDTKITCIECHVEPECLSRDLMCTEP
jgi:hypothetical protein